MESAATVTIPTLVFAAMVALSILGLYALRLIALLITDRTEISKL